MLEDPEDRVGFGDKEAAFGEAFGGELAEEALEVAAALLESACDVADLGWSFVDEFEAVVVDAGAVPVLKMGGSVLGLGAEDRVAAADVGDDRVAAALLVFKRDLVMLAGPAAVEVAGAL